MKDRLRVVTGFCHIVAGLLIVLELWCDWVEGGPVSADAQAVVAVILIAVGSVLVFMPSD